MAILGHPRTGVCSPPQPGIWMVAPLLATKHFWGVTNWARPHLRTTDRRSAACVPLLFLACPAAGRSLALMSFSSFPVTSLPPPYPTNLTGPSRNSSSAWPCDNPPNLRHAVNAAVMRMFVRMFKSPFGHRRHYADAAHQREGGSASPLSMER